MYARLARPRRLLGGPLQPLGWLLTAVLACSFARLAGIGGRRSGRCAVRTHGRADRHAAAARGRLALAHRAGSRRQRVRGGPRPRPRRAARRSARPLQRERAAHRCPGERGRRHARLPAPPPRRSARDRTVVLNLDEVGGGTVRYTRREGPVLALRSHPQLAALAGEIAVDGRSDGPRALDNRAPSDGFAASSAGYAALTVTCRDELGLAPRHHRRSDLPEHVQRRALADAPGVLRGADRASRRPGGRRAGLTTRSNRARRRARRRSRAPADWRASHGSRHGRGRRP